MRSKILTLFSLITALSLVLSACGEKEVEVTRVVTEKETIVETVKETVVETVLETVTETVIVEGTPEVREVEVTREVVSEVEVEVVVTATPPPEEEKEVELVYGDLPRDQTFIVASQAPNNDVWDSFNPYQAATYNNGGGYTQLALEPAFLEWNGVVYPWLAQSWTYNDDGTEFTLTITEGANWNDGMPLTIDDWLFTLQYNKDNVGQGIAAAAFLTDVEWVAEGDNQIVFTLPEPNFRFHTNFSSWGLAFTPMPKHIWEGQDPVTFTNPDAIGSGPYRLVSTNSDTRTVIWERRDDYWDQDRLPAPRYQVWLKRPEPDVAVFEWEAGNYDLGRIPFQMMTRMMSNNSYIKPLVHPDPCPRGLVFNVEIEPLNDPLFRRALGLLVNRQAVANLANVPSYVTPVLWPNTGEIDERFYDAAAAEEFDVTTFDPEKAVQLLDEAGYELVDGVRLDKSGNPISLDALYIDVGNPAWTVWAWLLSEQAGKVGIEVNPRLLDIPTFFAQGPIGEFDILFRWFCTAPSDPTGMYAPLHSDYAVPIGESSSGIPGRYQNPEMDAIIDQIAVGDPADPATQELFRQAYRIWAEEQPYLSLFGENEGVVANNKHWTGLEVGLPWIHWTPSFRQMLTYIVPAQ